MLGLIFDLSTSYGMSAHCDRMGGTGSAAANDNRAQGGRPGHVKEALR